MGVGERKRGQAEGQELGLWWTELGILERSPHCNAQCPVVLSHRQDPLKDTQVLLCHRLHSSPLSHTELPTSSPCLLGPQRLMSL